MHRQQTRPPSRGAERASSSASDSRGTPGWVWALGCLGLALVGGVSALGLAVWDWVSLHSPVFLQAQEAAQSSPAVTARVGGPPEIFEVYPRGEVQLTDGGGTARYVFTASGPKGKADVQVYSLRGDLGWEVQEVQLQDDAGAWVTAVPPSAPDLTTAPSSTAPSPTAPTLTVDPALAKSLVGEARTLYDRAQYSSAVAKLDAAVAADPRSSDAWLWRGRARQQLGDELGAASDLSLAVEADPSNSAAWASLAWVEAHAGRDDRALESLNHLLALTPGDAKALNDRANARFHLGQLVEARSDAQASCSAGYSAGCTTLERLQATR